MYGPKTRRGRALGNDTDEEAVAYSGVGLVQTTGENNMEAVEEMIRDEYPEAVARFEARTGKRFDLTIGDDPDDRRDPDNLLDPELSYIALAAGTRHGLYGPPLSRYINPSKCDYVNARRSVNVLDKAEQIAGYARKIEAALRAGIDAATSSVATHAALPATDAAAAGSPSGSQPAVVETAEVQTATVATAAVSTDASTVTTVTSRTRTLAAEVTGWIGGIFAAASSHVQSALGLSPEIQKLLIYAVIALGILWFVGKVVAQWQIRAIAADPTKINVK
jgi:hypothetical protein